MKSYNKSEKSFPAYVKSQHLYISAILKSEISASTYFSYYSAHVLF